MARKAVFEFIRGAVTHCPPAWDWNNLGENGREYNLWLVTAGRGWMRAGGMKREIAAGDCFLLRMWQPCHGSHDPQNPLSVTWIVFRGPAEHKLPGLHRRLSSLPFFNEVLERALTAFTVEDLPEKGVHWLKAALTLLSEEDKKPMVVGLEVDQRRVIGDIQERIRKYPGQHYSVNQLALECHYSPDHFARLFHKFTGESPRSYITKTRIEAARGLLSMSSQSIGQIAAALGFVDAFHLSREFKRQIGTSPSSYRNRKK